MSDAHPARSAQSSSSPKSTAPDFEPTKKGERVEKPATRRQQDGGGASAAAPTKTRAVPKFLRHAPAILLVTGASGLLFTVSALNNYHSLAPADINLVTLVKQSQEKVKVLEAQTEKLQDQINAMTPKDPTEVPTTIPALTQVPVRGPGVSISLTDAQTDVIPDGVTANDLVIHQQDIEDVMNALWEGKAEAMTVQGVRVTSRTVIRCIGNVILVDGTSYSPPYVIEAIGDPDRLAEAVNSNPRIVNYKAYVALYGLGWDLAKKNSLEFPAATQDSAMKYAQVVDANG
ncbi:DUF881 domain-containing protein [Schaalia sp. ZJ1691]|uniref:DUF881 domain-containing protein n=1 Tax=Schaalia sp. ZJ1691 TaxID=2709404 RepID=UPI0013ED74A3